MGTDYVDILNNRKHGGPGTAVGPPASIGKYYYYLYTHV